MTLQLLVLKSDMTDDEVIKLDSLMNELDDGSKTAAPKMEVNTHDGVEQ